jgi:hypothetical protein
VRIILTSHPASRALPFPKKSKEEKLENQSIANSQFASQKTNKEEKE